MARALRASIPSRQILLLPPQSRGGVPRKSPCNTQCRRGWGKRASSMTMAGAEFTGCMTSLGLRGPRTGSEASTPHEMQRCEIHVPFQHTQKEGSCCSYGLRALSKVNSRANNQPSLGFRLDRSRRKPEVAGGLARAAWATNRPSESVLWILHGNAWVSNCE